MASPLVLSDAARSAPNAGNRRLLRFVAIENPLTLRLLRMVSPGCSSGRRRRC